MGWTGGRMSFQLPDEFDYLLQPFRIGGHGTLFPCHCDGLQVLRPHDRAEPASPEAPSSASAVAKTT